METNKPIWDRQRPQVKFIIICMKYESKIRCFIIISILGMNSSRKSSGRSSKRNDEAVEINSVPASIQHREQAAKLTNKFLTAFLDHSLEDLDYEVREKRFLERLLDVELMDDGNYKSLFLYNTSGDSQSFQRCIWYEN